MAALCGDPFYAAAGVVPGCEPGCALRCTPAGPRCLPGCVPRGCAAPSCPGPTGPRGPRPPAVLFQVALGLQQPVLSSSAPVLFDAVFFGGDYYDGATGAFTAPLAGVYVLQFQATLVETAPIVGVDQVTFALQVDGAPLRSVSCAISVSAPDATVSGLGILSLQAGQQVTVAVVGSQDALAAVAPGPLAPRWTSFSGYSLF